MPPKASTAACAIASADSGERTSTPVPIAVWPFATSAGGCLVGRVARSRSATTTDGARLAQRLGVDDADAAGAAGDDGHLVGQVEELCELHGLDKTTNDALKSSSL